MHKVFLPLFLTVILFPSKEDGFIIEINGAVKKENGVR
jgi:hypothetical protein